MTISQRMIIFTNYLTIGLMQPILSLLLLNRGISLNYLSLSIGIYSITVLLTELPSGIIADIYGRKMVFLFSILMNILSIIVLFYGHGLLEIAMAMILQGLGRSFSSGSIDALIIDSCLEKLGNDATVKVTSQLAIFQSLGIGLGAILSGFIPTFNTYHLHLIIKLGLLLLLSILCKIFVKENRLLKKTTLTFREHVVECIKLGITSKTIKVILFGTFVTGGLLITVETYWQPAFTNITAIRYNPLLGFICFLGFMSVTFSNFIMLKLKINPVRMEKIYFLFKALLGMGVLFFAMQKNIPGFIFGYSFTYFFLGLADVAELSIINHQITSEKRASFLSLLSLVMQVGCFVSCILSSILLKYLTIPQIWIMWAAILTAFLPFFIYSQIKGKTS